MGIGLWKQPSPRGFNPGSCGTAGGTQDFCRSNAGGERGAGPTPSLPTCAERGCSGATGLGTEPGQQQMTPGQRLRGAAGPGGHQGLGAAAWPSPAAWGCALQSLSVPEGPGGYLHLYRNEAES